MLRLAVASVASALVTTAGVAWGQAASEPQPQPQTQPTAPGTAAQPAAPSTPPPGARPPPQYYVEPSSPPGQAQPAAPPAGPPPGPPPGAQVYEPPPPGYAPQLVYEPPPPPLPRHIAPKYSLWLGARLGWFVPFGSLWDRCTVVDSTGNCASARSFEGVPVSDYASSGPMFELDAGARLGRNYNLFLLWERTELGKGSLDPDPRGEQDGGDTDFFALALRVSSDPDKVGFVTEIALGARRMRTTWKDGGELQLTEAPFEARLGLGADIRLTPAFTLSPLFTIGVGAFGEAEYIAPDGTSSKTLTDIDRANAHGWLTLQIGAHFDVAGGG